MNQQYIQPDSLTGFEVRKVLDFLNQVQTAEEIASTIEISNERDVGVGVGQRLLDQRAQLGGRFQFIQEVADTPYVGEERFTEIVFVLTGKIAQVTPSDSRIFSNEIEKKLNNLRQQIQSLQNNVQSPAYIINMRLANENVLLGQAAIILIEVRDSLTGKLKPNVSMMLSTSWGMLQANMGFEKRQGEVIHVYSDIQGQIKVQLTGPVFEQLTQAQQLALQVALDKLDASAQTPADIQTQVSELVNQYKISSNSELRKAIDIYFQTRKAALAEPVNLPATDYLWPIFNAVIQAYIYEGVDQQRNSGMVNAMAVLRVQVKDWLLSWYQTYVNQISSSLNLRSGLVNLASKETNAGFLVNDMLGFMSSYTSNEFGLVGQFVSEKAVQRQVNQFLANDLVDMPVDTKQILFQTVGAASKNINTSQLGTFSVVNRLRTDVSKDVDNLKGQLGDAAMVSDLVLAVQSDIDAFNINYNKFNFDVGTFNENYSKFNIDYGDFARDYSAIELVAVELQVTADRIDESVAGVNLEMQNVNNNIDNFKVDYGKFETNVNAFNRDYTTFKKDVVSVPREIIIDPTGRDKL